MVLLASSDGHSCETLAEYAGVATSRPPCIYECLIDPLIAKKCTIKRCIPVQLFSST
jgi:hypothetical protein